jgi:hypothetical protein
MIPLICVNVPDVYENYLTIGKIYQGEEGTHAYHSVLNDKGGNKDFYIKCTDELGFISKYVIFIKLENWRELQINKVL